jgi:hypothetical protein
MELSIRLIFKVEELDRLIEIFKQLQLQGLSLNMSPSEFEKYTVYLLIALFDRIVEFELTWHSFVFEKAKQYKKNLEKSETTVLKMILMNLTCSAMKPKKQTVSFLQLYYLQMYKGEKLNGGPQDSWDFELRALKRKILDEASQRFRCGYDLDEAIDMNSSSLLLMFKGMMSDPYNCKYWRKLAQGLLRVSKRVLIAASVEIATVERLTHDLEANKRAR